MAWVSSGILDHPSWRSVVTLNVPMSKTAKHFDIIAKTRKTWTLIHKKLLQNRTKQLRMVSLESASIHLSPLKGPPSTLTQPDMILASSRISNARRSRAGAPNVNTRSGRPRNIYGQQLRRALERYGRPPSLTFFSVSSASVCIISCHPIGCRCSASGGFECWAAWHFRWESSRWRRFASPVSLTEIV